jgi:hypothetical protein
MNAVLSSLLPLSRARFGRAVHGEHGLDAIQPLIIRETLTGTGNVSNREQHDWRWDAIDAHMRLCDRQRLIDTVEPHRLHVASSILFIGLPPDEFWRLPRPVRVL